MIFKRLSVARNCPRPETAPWQLKEGLFVISQKKLKSLHFMEHSDTGFKFSITIKF